MPSNKSQYPYASKKVLERRTAHSAHVIIVLSHGVLLILVDPLVEVGLEEMNLSLGFQQAGPELLLELLLSQDNLDPARSVVDLALLGLNLGEKIELDVVGCFAGVGVASEVKRFRLNVKLELVCWDIRYDDSQEDVVSLSVGGGRALSPVDFERVSNAFIHNSAASGLPEDGIQFSVPSGTISLWPLVSVVLVGCSMFALMIWMMLRAFVVFGVKSRKATKSVNDKRR